MSVARGNNIEKKFQSREYRKILKKNGKRDFVVDKTGKVYLLRDYSLVKKKGGIVTLCRKLILSAIRKGVSFSLRPNEYEVFPNLSVYHIVTENIFS